MQEQAQPGTINRRYIGTKVIQGWPMTRAAYNTYRGWALPENENGADEGYLVEYLDGGKPNDSRHAGYISWSPKAQFDAAYRERPLTNAHAPHQQRVVDEKADLDEKIEKLGLFFATPTFTSLPAEEQSRLRQQQHAMTAYSCILRERIEAFPAPVDPQPV
jgi:hypothetical protein